MKQEDEAGGPQDTGKSKEPEGSAEKAGSKKDKYQKAQAKAEYAGEKLGKERGSQEGENLRDRDRGGRVDCQVKCNTF